MALFPAVVLLLALVVAELSSENAAPYPGLRAVGCLLLMSVAPLWNRWRLRRLESELCALVQVNAERLARRLDRYELTGLWLWGGCGMAAICGLGWAQIVRQVGKLVPLPAVDDLLLVTPLLVGLIALWRAAYPLERLLGGASFPSRGAWLWQRFTHGPLLVLLPVLFLLAAQDVAAWLLPQLSEEAKLALVYLPALLMLLIGFPLLVRLLWETRSLPAGELRERLEHTLLRAGIPALDILLWNSPGGAANAAVTGVLPRYRYVLLTEGLATRLTVEQIEAIFWHELGHIRHRHLWLRLLAVLLPVALAPLAWDLWQQSVVMFPESWLAQLHLKSVASSQPVLFGMAGLVVAIVGLGIGFGLLARRLEWQADLYAYRQLALAHGGGAGGPDADEALRKYCGALSRLAAAAGIEPHKFQWQHGSIACRIARLCYWHQRPEMARRFEQRLRLATALLVGAVVAGLTHCGLKLLG